MDAPSTCLSFLRCRGGSKDLKRHLEVWGLEHILTRNVGFCSLHDRSVREPDVTGALEKQLSAVEGSSIIMCRHQTLPKPFFHLT